MPNCAVIVATVRALKMHGGGPKVNFVTPVFLVLLQLSRDGNEVCMFKGISSCYDDEPVSLF